MTIGDYESYLTKQVHDLENRIETLLLRCSREPIQQKLKTYKIVGVLQRRREGHFEKIRDVRRRVATGSRSFADVRE